MNKRAKLDALVACGSSKLDGISAWPRSVLFDQRHRKPCGILMQRIVDSRHLHELYGTHNRRMHFPEVKWQHLIWAARNVAAAFESLHAAGIVVGDVNQGNLMVDRRMCVRFIDCDSFQIISNGTVFRCPVGTPHFTPPELQSKNLRNVLRTPDHDRFGMAILIFHLLFVGRHPFAGRCRGSKELTIEQAIAQRQFAFSRHTRDQLFGPPPASLLLDDLPETIADLFERAFCRDRGERPSARLWVERLEAVVKQRKICSFDPSHIFYSRLERCPWCRIEEQGGPAFFLPDGETAAVSQDRIDALNRRIGQLTIPLFPDFNPRCVALPHALHPKPSTRPPKISRSDLAARLMALSVGLCVLSLSSGLVGVVCPFLAVACALWGAGFLLFSNEASGRRRQVLDFTQRLAQIQSAILPRLQATEAGHLERKSEFDRALADFRTQREHYQAKQENLAHILALQRNEQEDQFLARHLIHEHVASIPGLNFSMVAVLQSFGVESALDINELYLSGIPDMGPILTLDLLRWRERIKAKYVFDGVTAEDIKNAGEAAFRRFKVSQARRVLRSARQLSILAESESSELQRQIKELEAAAARGRDVAARLKDYQSGRRPLERLLNRSPVTIIVLAVAIQLCALIFLLT